MRDADNVGKNFEKTPKQTVGITGSFQKLPA